MESRGKLASEIVDQIENKLCYSRVSKLPLHTAKIF